jgi:hypothetical protein
MGVAVSERGALERVDLPLLERQGVCHDLMKHWVQECTHLPRPLFRRVPMHELTGDSSEPGRRWLCSGKGHLVQAELLRRSLNPTIGASVDCHLRRVESGRDRRVVRP